MSYTKGPWVYSKHRATHDCCIHQVSADDSKYGYIQPDEGGVVGSSEWIWINDDDGYLIAAAPDLYEALKRVIGGRDWGNVEDHVSNCMCLYHEAIRALSKAEGRSND